MNRPLQALQGTHKPGQPRQIFQTAYAKLEPSNRCANHRSLQLGKMARKKFPLVGQR